MPEPVDVIIETPKGSRNKYTFDEKGRFFYLKKVLPSGMVFPFDFGFIPGTRGGDGDPLDVLLILEDSAPQGAHVSTRLIAVIEAEQTAQGKTGRNDRLIGIGAMSRDYRAIESIEQLS